MNIAELAKNSTCEKKTKRLVNQGSIQEKHK